MIKGNKGIFDIDIGKTRDKINETRRQQHRQSLFAMWFNKWASIRLKLLRNRKSKTTTKIEFNDSHGFPDRSWMRLIIVQCGLEP